MLSLVVLISGTGSNLRALLEAAADAEYPARVVAVGADRDADGLEIAEAFGIPSFTVAHSSFESREAWGDALLEQILQWQPDIVVLSGFMRLLPPRVVAALSPNLINTHPAYLPEFPGAHAVRDALGACATRTGASLIVVDDGVDAGPVIVQERVGIRPDDTEAALHERIKAVERRLLVQTILDIANGQIDLKELAATMSGASRDPEQTHARDTVAIRRALISVSDKSGLIPLASALADAGVEIVSTGTTAATIRAAGHEVTEVAEVTGFPESLDGRVKTLHPAVHGGLLADLRRESHAVQLRELGIEPFELVVVNLYPFVETVASGARGDEVVEQIDIGGPAMVRAAAKNFANVAIVVSPERYPELIEALGRGGTTLRQRTELAAAAYAHTAAYDTAVAAWFGAGSAETGAETAGRHSEAVAWPPTLELAGELVRPLRYGENSHQAAALYRSQGAPGIAQADQLSGKEMSYNNYVDADAALRSAFDFDEPAVAIIKHANPCGIAVAADIATAHAKAHECDSQSAYGGVVAANGTVTLAMAQKLKGIFTEVLIAPDFEPDALELLTTKKDLRILRLPSGYRRADRELRQLSGGFLAQEPDTFAGFSSSGWQLVAGAEADTATRADLEFAWKACRSVKSNAILLAHDGASVGVGMGQVNRVDSCRLAVGRAGDRAAGSVAASDAFFPFPDGLEILLEAGIRAVVQPGGSIRDALAIEAATRAGVTMYLTGERHFFH